MEVIFCANGNEDYATQADKFFTYGAKLPGTVYITPEFIDNEWENPNRLAYMATLEKWKPRLATVLDWERPEQLPEVLSWAEEAAACVSEAVLIIPKVLGGVKYLPESIGNIPVRLAFSYPTGYGAANWSILDEMGGWPNGIHILGGPPHAQLAIRAGLLKRPRCKTPKQRDLFVSALDVRSVDCNYHLFLANKGLVWEGNANGTEFRHVSLKEINKGKLFGDGTKKAGASYEAFKRSCQNMAIAWGIEQERNGAA